MTYAFVYDERLGIPLPELQLEWEQYNETERRDIVCRWEQIRGRIPERILKLEQDIVVKQNQLDTEEDFAVSCMLNAAIAELASRINDLHIWFRVNQDVEPAVKHD